MDGNKTRVSDVWLSPGNRYIQPESNVSISP
jgi:hypothetical protein